MEALIKYLVVFVQAAIPWLEVLVAIPVGAAMGLALGPVALVALVGNVLAVYLIIVGFRWWEERRGPVRRRWSDRAMRTWNRYGVPGLALLGPLLLGSHLAAVMALAMGASRVITGVWMVVGIVVWTGITLAGTALGVAWFTDRI